MWSRMSFDSMTSDPPVLCPSDPPVQASALTLLLAGLENFWAPVAACGPLPLWLGIPGIIQTPMPGPTPS